MKTIFLPKNKYTLVDDEDYEFLSTHKWNFNRYAIRAVNKNGKWSTLRMHKEILRKHHLLREGYEIDHINRNKLDNRKSNLRLATRSENKLNGNKYKNNTSGYKGVSWNQISKKWNARIMIRGSRINLGHYKNKQIAVLAQKIGEILNGIFFFDSV